MLVVTADQRSSRRSEDLVPHGLALVERAAAGRLALPPERNAGDELQALTGEADAALEIALALLRDGRWSVGIGAGAVELPLPDDVRAARGAAFVRARDAVERAKSAPGRVAVTGGDPETAQDAEAILRLLVDVRDRRSDAGWQIADLLADGRTQTQAAEALGITQTAVSLRAKAAGLRVDEGALPVLARAFHRLDRTSGP